MKIVVFEQYRGEATVKIGHYFFTELMSSEELSIKIVGEDYPADNLTYKDKPINLEEVKSFNPDALFFGTWYINKIIKGKDHNAIETIKDITKPKFCIVTDYPYRKEEHDKIWKRLNIKNILCLDGSEHSLRDHDYFKYYYFPWSINENSFFDRKQIKKYKTSVFGGIDPSLYPMRLRVNNLFHEAFGQDHFYLGPVYDYMNGNNPSMEEYSRLINQCKICFTDGHYAELANAKYSEIAGSNCLIMSPKFETSKDLDLAGFEENENIIYVNYKDSDTQIIEKTKKVLEDSSRLEKMSLSGYNLIHTKHTNKNRVKDLMQIIKSATQ